LAVGEFDSVKDGDVHGIQLEYFGVKGKLLEITSHISGFPRENLLRTFKQTSKIMPFLEQRLGNKFPYPKYFQIVVPKLG
jgi:hypothetical protein